MPFKSKLHPICNSCGKPMRVVWGSKEWHEKNDPAGGYCGCPGSGLAGLSGVAKTMAIAPQTNEDWPCRKRLPIEDAIKSSLGTTPTPAPRRIFAAAHVLLEEVQRLRATAVV